MSHTVDIDVHIVKLDLLINSFEELGWEIKQNCKIRTYHYDEARNTIYDYVAVNPKGRFDLGIKFIDGEYRIFGDFYDQTIQEQLGTALAKLKTLYNFKFTKQILDAEEIEYEVVDNEDILELQVVF